MDIRTGDLDDPAVRRLLSEHLGAVARHSPPESIHALAPEDLGGPAITFWCAWDGAALLGCGALQELTPEHGEVKSMRTSTAHLRRGVGSRVLRPHIIDEAGRRAYRRLSLETGSADAFLPARRLYASFGFAPCGPFADYVEDPYSVFMTKVLA